MVELEHFEKAMQASNHYETILPVHAHTPSRLRLLHRNLLRKCLKLMVSVENKAFLQ